MGRETGGLHKGQNSDYKGAPELGQVHPAPGDGWSKSLRQGGLLEAKVLCSRQGPVEHHGWEGTPVSEGQLRTLDT